MNSIGVDFKLKNILCNDKKVKLQIWDTAGQERFRAITTSYYKGAQCIAIVFDLTERDSFDHLKNWMTDIDKFAKDGVMKILVGNKADLDHKRTVSNEEGKHFAKVHQMEYIETSAKDSSNIDCLFVNTTKNYIQFNSNNLLKKSTASFTGEGIVVSSQLSSTTNKKGCC